MVKSKQNQVPPEFSTFYEPILQLKKQLTSKAKELAAENTVPGFMMLHFSCFVMNHLYKQTNKDNSKVLIIREIIEYILSQNSFYLDNNIRSKLTSFIDNLAKELNTAFKAYVYIAFYQAYLDSEIYRRLHPNLGIFDFAAYNYIQPETAASVKNYYHASLELLKELNLPIDKQTTLNKQIYKVTAL